MARPVPECPNTKVLILSLSLLSNSKDFEKCSFIEAVSGFIDSIFFLMIFLLCIIRVVTGPEPVRGLCILLFQWYVLDSHHDRRQVHYL